MAAGDVLLVEDRVDQLRVRIGRRRGRRVEGPGEAVVVVRRAVGVARGADAVVRMRQAEVVAGFVDRGVCERAAKDLQVRRLDRRVTVRRDRLEDVVEG